MNSAYSNLINSIPGQISLSGNFQDQINPIFNYTSNEPSPLLNLYNPAYAVAAQSRLLSTLQPTESPNNLTPNDVSASSSITSIDQNQNLPLFNHGHPEEATSTSNIPFYQTNSFQNNSQLCCDFGSAWRSAAHMMATDHNPYVSYDNSTWSNPYGYMGNATLDLNSARRKNATRESTSTLKAWLQEHIKNPYPTKGEKIMLAIITKMTLTQVSTWFANARRRLKKENKMTWSPKNRSDDATNSDLETDVKCKDNDSDDGRKTDHLDSLSESEEIAKNKNNFPSKLSDAKPKIWSLAHTATSGLFPLAIQPYQRQCMDDTSEGHLNGVSHQYPSHIPMPLIQNHPLYHHGFNNSLDIAHQQTCSELKQYSSVYSDHNPDSFFAQSQKRSELL